MEKNALYTSIAKRLQVEYVQVKLAMRCLLDVMVEYKGKKRKERPIGCFFTVKKKR